jgi:hypothetical protein
VSRAVRSSRRATLGLALLALLPGCGYSTGFRLPEGMQSVGVEVFGNDSKLRDVELEFQEALVDSTARLVHAPIVDPSEADLVLRGRIVDYRRRGGIRSADNELLESGVTVVVEVQLVRRFAESEVRPGPEPARSDAPPAARDDRISIPPTAPNERVLRPMRAIQEFGYRLAESYGEARARERTLANLADRIVLDLFGTLAYEAGP